MNAAVRAVARTAAFFEGWEVMGVNAGYRGLLEGRIYPMDRRRLGGIVHRDGTVLGTERAPEMVQPEGQRRAAGARRLRIASSPAGWDTRRWRRWWTETTGR